ncbi:hypothetical protein [Nocardiopsis sp. NPDC057823]|uniref:hypothetical protein n=1 Tax=Nocardiopsis sp. NPDC057823 TaxID=3346256 RepID=UPI0036730499
MKRSVYNSTTTRVSIGLDTISATANGSTVDRSEPDLSNFRSAMLVVVAGDITDGTHALKLQESDNGSNWSDVDAAHLQGPAISLDSGTAAGTYEQGYTGGARYLRAVTTVAGSPVTGGVYGALIVLSEARRTPIPRS